MKKTGNILILVFCLILTLGLIACGDQESPNKIDATEYKVTCKSSDYYICDGTKKSTAGQTATVRLTSNYPAYEITGCTFNENACTKKTNSTTETQEFEFTMPQSDVEVVVIYEWKDLSQSGKENFLCFDSSNDYSLISAIGDSTYNNDEDSKILLFDLFNNKDYNMMTGAMGNIITCFSSNQDILPSEGIKVEPTISSTSNSIIGGKIIIDRSMAKVGSTQIVLRIKSGNNTTYDAIIVKTINISK